MVAKKLYENHLKEVNVIAGTEIHEAVAHLYSDYLSDRKPRFICFNGVNIVIF